MGLGRQPRNGLRKNFHILGNLLSYYITYPPITEPTPPPCKRRIQTQPRINQRPVWGTNPQGQPEAPTSPLVTHGPPSYGSPNGGPDLSLPPSQLQGMHNDLLSPIIAPLPPIIRGYIEISDYGCRSKTQT